MPVFVALYLAAAVAFSAAMVIYLRTGFTRRCAPLPLTALGAWAAWDAMQVFGVMVPYDLVYYAEPGFVVVESLLLYLCWANRARHYPGVPAVWLAGYLLVVIALSGAVILALNHLLGDPRGVVSQALVAVLFPALVVAGGRDAPRAGQHPVAAVLFAVAIGLASVAMVVDPPPGSRSGLNAVVYGVVLLFSAAYAWSAANPRRRPAEAGGDRRPA